MPAKESNTQARRSVLLKEQKKRILLKEQKKFLLKEGEQKRLVMSRFGSNLCILAKLWHISGFAIVDRASLELSAGIWVLQ